VLSWRLSNSIDGVFCIDALEHAIHYCGEPKIYNADKSDQKTSKAFIVVIKDNDTDISMDGKGV